MHQILIRFHDQLQLNEDLHYPDEAANDILRVMSSCDMAHDSPLSQDHQSKHQYMPVNGLTLIPDALTHAAPH